MDGLESLWKHLTGEKLINQIPEDVENYYRIVNIEEAMS